MSDFFGDDFTAELKAYFLDSLVQETEKFIDLVDEGIWRRIRSEVLEAMKTWVVDAKTNEFLHLMSWLELYAERTQDVESAADFLKSLQVLKNYAETLKVEKDSLELAEKFSHVVKSQKQALFLHCQFGLQDFAVPLLGVVEIIDNLTLYPLPQKKPGFLGVIPVRGEAIPVVNLQDHGFFADDTSKKLYVVCEHGGVRFSLQVTKTESLVNLRDSELHAVEGQGCLIQASFVKEFFMKENKNIMVIDLEKLVA